MSYRFPPQDIFYEFLAPLLTDWSEFWQKVCIFLTKSASGHNIQPRSQFLAHHLLWNIKTCSNLLFYQCYALRQLPPQKLMMETSNFLFLHIFYCERVRERAGHAQAYTGWTKKRVISKNKAITTLKSIRKGKNNCVLENSAQMLLDRDQTFQNWWKNGLEK